MSLQHRAANAEVQGFTSELLSPLGGSCLHKDKVGLECFELVSVPLHIWSRYQYANLNIFYSKEEQNITQLEPQENATLRCKIPCLGKR